MNRATDERGHFFIMADAVFDCNLSPYEGWLYTAIVKHADRKTGESFPSVKTLAKICNMSKASVIRYTKLLESKGLIRVERDDNTPGKDRESNHYFVLPIAPPVSVSNRGGICEQLPPVAVSNTNKSHLEQEKDSAPISAGTNLIEQYVENHLTIPDDAPAEQSPDDTIPESHKPRDPLFDAVAQHVYKTDPALVKTDGGRIGAITAWLAGKSDGMKRGKGAKVVVGYISAPAKPGHVQAFMQWYEDTYPNISLRDFEKFVEYWRQWATEMNQRKQRQPVIEPRKERYL